MPTNTPATTYFPGTRLKVFDHRLFLNDRDTPLSQTMQPCTVLRWYGKCDIPAFEDRHRTPESWGGLSVEEVRRIWRYESLVDVRFDRDGRESRGHFADHRYVEVLTA